MSWAVWITGLPGSGKSVIAATTAEMLEAWDCPVVVLELDQIRRVITPHPTYSDAEHEAVYRALVYIGAGLVERGIPVMCADVRLHIPGTDREQKMAQMSTSPRRTVLSERSMVRGANCSSADDNCSSTEGN